MAPKVDVELIWMQFLTELKRVCKSHVSVSCSRDVMKLRNDGKHNGKLQQQADLVAVFHRAWICFLALKI